MKEDLAVIKWFRILQYLNERRLDSAHNKCKILRSNAIECMWHHWYTTLAWACRLYYCNIKKKACIHFWGENRKRVLLHEQLHRGASRTINKLTIFSIVPKHYLQDGALSCGKHHKWSSHPKTLHRYLHLFSEDRKENRTGNLFYNMYLDKWSHIYTLACSSSSKSRTPAPSPITNPSRFCSLTKERLGYL